MQRGLSQTDLAAAVNISGSYLSLIESGRRPASGPILDRVASALATTRGHLETGRGGTDDSSIELDLRFAELALRSGEPDEALRRFSAVRAAADARGWRDVGLDAAWGWARSLEAVGRLEDAIEAYEAIAAGGELPPTLSRVVISTALCRAYSECGDLARAVEVGEAALAAASEPVGSDPRPAAGDVSSVAQGEEELVALASTLVGCYYERGDLTRAHTLAQATLRSADESQSPLSRAAALWNASLVEEARGDLRAARGHADRALALYSESDNARAVALLRVLTAWLMLREAEPHVDEAEALLYRALDDLAAIGTPVDAAYAETELARCRLLAGDWIDAIRIAEESLAHLGSGPRLEAGRARLVIGHALLAAGDREGAVSAYREAASDLAAQGAQRQAAAAWRELAEALAGMGQAAEALDAYRQASDAAGVRRAPERVAVRSHAAARRS